MSKPVCFSCAFTCLAHSYTLFNLLLWSSFHLLAWFSYSIHTVIWFGVVLKSLGHISDFGFYKVVETPEIAYHVSKIKASGGPFTFFHELNLENLKNLA